MAAPSRFTIVGGGYGHGMSQYGAHGMALRGASAGGFNTDTTGVALLGTFTTARPRPCWPAWSGCWPGSST